MNTKILFHDKTIKKVICLIYLILLYIVIFYAPVDALPQCGNINIGASIPDSNIIVWSYNYEDNITTASIDGILISDLDNQSGIISLMADGRNFGNHTLRLTNETNSGCNISRILSPVKTSSENITDVINMYILFILGLVCLIVGFKIPPLGLGAALFGLLGLLAYNNSVIMILLYVVLMIVGFIEIVSGSDWA